MSEEEDRRNLGTLAIFHWVVAGITVLFALFPVFHLVIGILMVRGEMSSSKPGPPQHSEVVFEQVFGWLFIAFAAGFILVGLALAACLAFAGKFLGERSHYRFCLVMAAIECVFFPFGTALGVFTLIVLSKPQVKALFALPAPTT